MKNPGSGIECTKNLDFAVTISIKAKTYGVSIRL